MGLPCENFIIYPMFDRFSMMHQCNYDFQ